MSTRPGSSPNEQLNKVQIPTYEYADGYEEHCRKILDDPHGKNKQFWQKVYNFSKGAGTNAKEIRDYISTLLSKDANRHRQKREEERSKKIEAEANAPKAPRVSDRYQTLKENPKRKEESIPVFKDKGEALQFFTRKYDKSVTEKDNHGSYWLDLKRYATKSDTTVEDINKKIATQKEIKAEKQRVREKRKKAASPGEEPKRQATEERKEPQTHEPMPICTSVEQYKKVLKERHEKCGSGQKKYLMSLYNLCFQEGITAEKITEKIQKDKENNTNRKRASREAKKKAENQHRNEDQRSQLQQQLEWQITTGDPSKPKAKENQAGSNRNVSVTQKGNSQPRTSQAQASSVNLRPQVRQAQPLPPSITVPTQPSSKNSTRAEDIRSTREKEAAGTRHSNDSPKNTVASGTESRSNIGDAISQRGEGDSPRKYRRDLGNIWDDETMHSRELDEIYGGVDGLSNISRYLAYDTVQRRHDHDNAYSQGSG